MKLNNLPEKQIFIILKKEKYFLKKVLKNKQKKIIEIY